MSFCICWRFISITDYQKQTGDIDAAILTDHMMLEATELGLGTVWVCYFQPDVIRKEFDLPDNLEPINILVIGYSFSYETKSVSGILMCM